MNQRPRRVNVPNKRYDTYIILFDWEVVQGLNQDLHGDQALSENM